MSSHHFVREGQEPALVILEAYSLEAVEALLEWAPLVVVTGDAVGDVLRWGIKIDVVATEHTNIPHLERQLADQGPVKFLDHSDKNLRSIFEFLVSNQQTAVTIVSSSFTGLADASQIFGGALNISILTPSVRWAFIASGHFKKWFPRATTLLIHSESPAQMYLPDGQIIPVADQNITNADGIITIEASDGFWIGEAIQ